MIKNKKRAGFTLLNGRKANLTGFTLMELLIVIAIIAILAAGLIVGLNPARHFKQARNSTRWQHMSAIASSVYSYAVEHEGNFPEGCIGTTTVPIDIVAADYENPTSTDWCCCGIDKVVPEYLRVIPRDPTAGENYQIEFIDSDRTGIKISSTADEANEAGNEIELTQ